MTIFTVNCTCGGTAYGYPQHENDCGEPTDLSPTMCIHPSERYNLDGYTWCDHCGSAVDARGWHIY